MPAVDRTRFLEAEQAFAAAMGLRMSERYLDIGTPVGRARVMETGEGPPVLFVHGGGGLGCHWFPLLGELTGHRLIVVDRPGCGLTDGFVYRPDTDLRAHAVDFLGGVLDALELESAHVVANSMGGLWSLWLALDEPGRVDSLALLGCPALVLGTSAPAPMRILSRRPLGWMLERPATTTSMRRVMAMMGHPKDFETHGADGFVEISVLGGNLDGAASSFRSLLGVGVRLGGANPECALGADELQTLGPDPLVIWGDSDPFGSLDVARQFANVTSGRLEVVGVGHLPWLDDPASAAQLLMAHLRAEQHPTPTRH